MLIGGVQKRTDVLEAYGKWADPVFPVRKESAGIVACFALRMGAAWMGDETQKSCASRIASVTRVCLSMA
ncbi:MAG: hypothetical protein D6690_15930 [Nitrospirae bacterium]|nr:MAG: hypothetical protein D6690_15930 [Nitrospirota bacterium]